MKNTYSPPETEVLFLSPEVGTDNAAYIPVTNTLKTLGKLFIAAGYENPFAVIFYDEDLYYGIQTSTEVDKRHAWSILLDDEIDPDPDEEESDKEEPITFTRFTKGQGLHVFPFLAF